MKPRAVVEPDKRWLSKLDEGCPYQVVLPRQQLTDDTKILDFLLAHVGWFDIMFAGLAGHRALRRWPHREPALAIEP